MNVKISGTSSKVSKSISGPSLLSAIICSPLSHVHSSVPSPLVFHNSCPFFCLSPVLCPVLSSVLSCLLPCPSVLSWGQRVSRKTLYFPLFFNGKKLNILIQKCKIERKIISLAMFLPQVHSKRGLCNAHHVTAMFINRAIFICVN